MLFVFLLTVYHDNAAPDVYVLDHSLSGTDCIERMMTFPTEGTRGVVSCEFDEGDAK